MAASTGALFCGLTWLAQGSQGSPCLSSCSIFFSFSQILGRCLNLFLKVTWVGFRVCPSLLARPLGLPSLIHSSFVAATLLTPSLTFKEQVTDAAEPALTFA